MTLQMKTRGMLIDEMLTAGIKVVESPSEENNARFNELCDLVTQLISQEEFDKIDPLRKQLGDELSNCWDAQECVMQYRGADLAQLSYAELQELGTAALFAQVTNGRRNKLIREIDAILGDSDTPLKKTYMV